MVASLWNVPLFARHNLKQTGGGTVKENHLLASEFPCVKVCAFE